MPREALSPPSPVCPHSVTPIPPATCVMPCLAPKPLHLPLVSTCSPMCPHLSLLLHLHRAVLPHLSFHVFLPVLPWSHVPHHMPMSLLCPHMHLPCIPHVPLHLLKCLHVPHVLPTPSHILPNPLHVPSGPQCLSHYFSMPVPCTFLVCSPPALPAAPFLMVPGQ